MEPNFSNYLWEVKLLFTPGGFCFAEIKYRGSTHFLIGIGELKTIIQLKGVCPCQVGLKKLWIIQLLLLEVPYMLAGGVFFFLGGVFSSLFPGGHVDLTAGEAEIRDGLGGTEGGGHLESVKSQFFRKNTPTSSQ